MRECVCVYGANVLSLVQSSRPLRGRVVSAAAAASGAGVAGGGGVTGGAGAGAGAVQAGRSTKELLMTLPCPSAQTVSKYNAQYHKLFQCVPKDEILMKGTVPLTAGKTFKTAYCCRISFLIFSGASSFNSGFPVLHLCLFLFFLNLSACFNELCFLQAANVQ